MNVQIEPLNLSHQDLLLSKFRDLNLSLSEYSFANLYLFRNLHHYEIMTINSEIFIRGLTRDQISYVMLTAHPTHYSENVLLTALLHAKMLFPIPENWLIYFEPFLLHASFKDEDSDYLFERNKLASFPGRNLSKKRNLVKQLQAHHFVHAENLIDQKEHALEITSNWLKENDGDPKETDFHSCIEAIQNFAQLHLHGRIVYIDGYPAGFTIGERTSNDCYTVHFSKGLKSVKGLPQFLYQDLGNSLDKSYSWINLEQDLGIPAIRHAKHSYLPDRYLVKWRLELN